jgi:hypothetical protein
MGLEPATFKATIPGSTSEHVLLHSSMWLT